MMKSDVFRNHAITKTAQDTERQTAVTERGNVTKKDKKLEAGSKKWRSRKGTTPFSSIFMMVFVPFHFEEDLCVFG